MFRFHEKMIKQAQEQAQEKEKVLIGFRLCLLHVLFWCQGCFYGEMRALVLALVSALVLASLVKFFITNWRNWLTLNRQTRERLDSGRNFWKFNSWLKTTGMRWNSDILTPSCLGRNVISTTPFLLFFCTYEKDLAQVNSVEIILSLWDIPKKTIIVLDFRLANNRLNAWN